MLCALAHQLDGWPPAQVILRAIGGLLRSVCPFLRDLRTVLYAVSHTSSGNHVSRYYVAEWRQVPFWACLSAVWQVPPLASRRLHTFVEYPVHSHLLKASPLSASSLSPFRPCTPTFDSQSPAVGRCCHPSTWGIGTDRAICLTYMDTQLYKVQIINLRTLPAHPPCFGARFRTNGSQSDGLGGPSLWANSSSNVRHSSPHQTAQKDTDTQLLLLANDNELWLPLNPHPAEPPPKLLAPPSERPVA
jgi:hypothetical protein